jgi:outer membrane murein-binding lipoprotein Lpp
LKNYNQRGGEKMLSKNRLVLVLAGALIVMLSLAGCASGVPQEQYDRLKDQMESAQAQATQLQEQVTGLQAEVTELESAKQEATSALQEAEDENSELQNQMEDLQSQLAELEEECSLVGDTPAETAEKIVKFYFDTHEYSAQDLFVCSDMAADVWNMLKAHGVYAVLAIGKTDATISNILQCDHAWVLAETAPGEYLALETTGGRVVPQSENPRYYQGWYFNTPSDLKEYNQLNREYNLRVDIHNSIVARANEVREEYNSATNQSARDRLEAVYQELMDLVHAQQEKMSEVKAEIDALATPL